MEPRMNEITEVNRNDLDWLRDQTIDVKMGLMQNHLSLCQLIANQIMEEEVYRLSGARYSRDKPHDGRYSRWATNPGSIRIGDMKLRVQVPRVRDTFDEQCVPLESYSKMHQVDAPTEQLIRAVLRGLSTRDYEGVIDCMGEGFGLKKSEVSRRFIEASKEKVKEFIERDLSGERFMAVIIDGSKGFRKAIKQIAGQDALIQRCTWHKLENIKSYLPEEEHSKVKEDYYRALSVEDHDDAKKQLLELEAGLRKNNIAAANSVMEAIDEILTLHHLGVDPKLRMSLRSTNCIENLNSQLHKYTRKVKNWNSSDQRYRWIASGLLEVEKKMRRISNYRKLPLLKKAILLHYSGGTSAGISTKLRT